MKVSECCLIKLIPYILLEKYINTSAPEMAIPGNGHCANCIGALFFAQIRIVARCETVDAYAYGDSDVISMPAGFRRHLVGKTPIKCFHCDIAEIRFVGEVVIIQTFSQTDGWNII